MKYLLILMILSMSCQSQEYSPKLWTDSTFTNSALVFSNVMLVSDWGQTLHIAQDDRYTEDNKYLGKNPSRRDVNLYFLQRLVVHNLVGYLLPKKYKNIFYVSVSAYQAEAVFRNYELGIRMKF